MTWYTLLADAVVAVHLAIVAFVIFGQLAIMVGVVCRWQWARNLWFRLGHLAVILIVAWESLSGIECPLTTWERNLRVWGGQTVSDGTFIGKLCHDWLFYDGPPEVFTACYVIFAALVLLTFVAAPPRWGRKRSPALTCEPSAAA
jgi:hypothetical protein